MQPLTAKCPKCGSRGKYDVIGDTFVASMLIYHMRCKGCGTDFEARAPQMKLKVRDL